MGRCPLEAMPHISISDHHLGASGELEMALRKVALSREGVERRKELVIGADLV